MKILEDGSVFMAAGEPLPLKCPECATYIPYVEDVAIVCPTCGHRDCHEEFSDVEYQMETKQ